MYTLCKKEAGMVRWWLHCFEDKKRSREIRKETMKWKGRIHYYWLDTCTWTHSLVITLLKPSRTFSLRVLFLSCCLMLYHHRSNFVAAFLLMSFNVPLCSKAWILPRHHHHHHHRWFLQNIFIYMQSKWCE